MNIHLCPGASLKIDIVWNSLNSYSKNSRQYQFLDSLQGKDEYSSNLISQWNMHTNFENTEGYLVCLMAQEWRSEFNDTPVPSFAVAANECSQFGDQGTYQDRQWSEINKIERNDRRHSIQGSVDTLRAVYGSFNEEVGSFIMSGGDASPPLIIKEPTSSLKDP